MADQASEGMLSPFLRRQRLNAAKPFLHGDVLDVGCGSGMLAEKVSPDSYLGVEIDPTSLNIAMDKFSEHRFQKRLPDIIDKFDTVVSLAVIEHVECPEDFLTELSKYLKNNNAARIVITTPHPSMDWVHDFGANIGLFSKHASEEHEELLDYTKLEVAGRKAGLNLIEYRRFLFGANQLAVFEI